MDKLFTRPALGCRSCTGTYGRHGRLVRMEPRAALPHAIYFLKKLLCFVSCTSSLWWLVWRFAWTTPGRAHAPTTTHTHHFLINNIIQNTRLIPRLGSAIGKGLNAIFIFSNNRTQKRTLPVNESSGD
jgi:hypothetical protein